MKNFSDNEILATIRDIIADALCINPSEVGVDDSLVVDLGAESIDFLDVVFQLESSFNINIKRGELETKAREGLTEEEFHDDQGVLTEVALVNLRLCLPEIDPRKIKQGMTQQDIPSLLTARSFLAIVKSGLSEVAGSEQVASTLSVVPDKSESVRHA